MKSALNNVISGAVKDAHMLNAGLCRAVEKQEPLYDQSHFLYRKRQAKETCWESVAKECNDNVASCKRRWRQIREEFSRCFNEPIKRNRVHKLKTFYLSEPLKFLIPFMANSSLSDSEFNSTTEEEHLDERMMQETEVVNKVSETFLDEEYGFIVPQGSVRESLNGNEGTKQSQLQQQQQQQQEDNQHELQEAEEREDGDTRSPPEHVEERQTFYIKQKSNDSCVLTISKVVDPLDTAFDVTQKNSPFDEDDVPLRDLSSSSKGRSLRGRNKSKKNVDNKQDQHLHGVQDAPAFKPAARVTRQQNRRKSVAASTASTSSLAAALEHDISLSPQTPKMSPVPKARQQQANRMSFLKTDESSSEHGSPTRQRQQQQHQLKQQQLNEQVKQHQIEQLEQQKLLQQQQQQEQEEQFNGLQEFRKQQEEELKQQKEEHLKQQREQLKQQQKQQELLIKQQQEQLKQQQEQLKQQQKELMQQQQQRQLLAQQQLKQNLQQQQLQQELKQQQELQLQQQQQLQQQLQQQQQKQQQILLSQSLQQPQQTEPQQQQQMLLSQSLQQQQQTEPQQQILLSTSLQQQQQQQTEPQQQQILLSTSLQQQQQQQQTEPQQQQQILLSQSLQQQQQQTEPQQQILLSQSLQQQQQTEPQQQQQILLSQSLQQQQQQQPEPQQQQQILLSQSLQQQRQQTEPQQQILLGTSLQQQLQTESPLQQQQQQKVVEDEFVTPMAHSSILMPEDGMEPQAKRFKQTINANTPVYISRDNSSPVLINTIVSDTNPVKQLPIKFFLHRSTQCGPEHTEFTDDDFLNAIQPQMREMNPRQKMHFKKKVFQALMEVFDDATDFPSAGDVQHFNINTPSGFENTSTQELHLLRELVSLVSAAKRTPEVQKLTNGSANQVVQRPLHASDRSNSSLVDHLVSTTTTPATTTKAPVVHQLRDEMGLPRNIIQRVIKMSEVRGDNNTTNMSVDKRVYRIMPKQTMNSKPSPSSSPNPNPNSAAVVSSANRQSIFAVPQVSLSNLSPPNKNTITSTITSGSLSTSQATQRPIASNGGAEGATSQTSARVALNQSVPTTSRAKTIQLDPNAAQSTSALAARRMPRRYSVCGISQNTPVQAVAKSSVSGESNPLALPMPMRNMIANNSAPKRRIGPSVLSHIRSRYPPGNQNKTGPSSKTSVPNSKEKTHTVSNAASASAGGGSHNTDFVAPPNAMPRKTQIDQGQRGIQFSKSPMKRSYVVRGINKTPVPASSAPVLPERNVQQQRTFTNNAPMETAATIAADDFTVRIKQEEDSLLGL